MQSEFNLERRAIEEKRDGKNVRKSEKRKVKLLCRQEESLLNPKKSLYFSKAYVSIFGGRLAVGLLLVTPCEFFKANISCPC